MNSSEKMERRKNHSGKKIKDRKLKDKEWKDWTRY